jgi:hypothetical protein
VWSFFVRSSTNPDPRLSNPMIRIWVRYSETANWKTFLNSGRSEMLTRPSLCTRMVSYACGKVRMIPIPVQIGFRIENRNPDPGSKVPDPNLLWILIFKYFWTMLCLGVHEWRGPDTQGHHGAGGEETSREGREESLENWKVYVALILVVRLFLFLRTDHLPF